MKQSDEITIYKSQDDNVKVNVSFSEENVWLTKGQMVSLFGKGRSTITEHSENIFKEDELHENMVCQEFRHTTLHGVIKGKM